MTNREAYNRLSPAEKIKYNETYSKHPLAPYIDWQAFYDSDDGNAMHFVKYICIVTIDDERIYLLQRNEDVCYCYNSTTGCYVELPSSMFASVFSSASAQQ